MATAVASGAASLLLNVEPGAGDDDDDDDDDDDEGGGGGGDDDDDDDDDDGGVSEGDPEVDEALLATGVSIDDLNPGLEGLLGMRVDVLGAVLFFIDG